MTIQTAFPEWDLNNTNSTKPAQAQIDDGFAAGDRPPAAWINWLFKQQGAQARAAYARAARDVDITDPSSFSVDAFSPQTGLVLWCPFVKAYLVFEASGTDPHIRITRDGRSFARVSGTDEPADDYNVTAAATDGAGTWLLCDSGDSAYFNPTPGDYSTWTEITNTTDTTPQWCFYHNGVWGVTRTGGAGNFETTTALSATPTWTSRTGGPVTPLSMCSNGSRILSVGGSCNAVAHYSDDGITWTAVNAATIGTSASSCRCVAWVDELEKFYVITSESTLELFSTPDGATWTDETSNIPSYIDGLAHDLGTDGRSLYLANASGTVQGSNSVWRTEDLSTWELAVAATSTTLVTGHFQRFYGDNLLIAQNGTVSSRPFDA